MSVTSRVPAYIRAISPYQPGKPISELAREMGIPEAKIIKLASNENPLGMSLHAREAAATALVSDGALYPDGNGFALKSALSGLCGVAPESLVLGNGSNNLLEMVAKAWLEPGCSAVYSQYSFAVYALATQAAGARRIEVPARDYAHDLDAMLAAIEADTRVIFLANPNNPTGTFIPGEVLRAFISRVPEDVLVVLDEAYTEYLDAADAYDSLSWIGAFPNLVVLRTFSKVYGLAGLRVGYAACAPDVADILNRVREPFNISVVALAAAVAAVGDQEFVARSAALNARGKLQLQEGFRKLGLTFVPSHGNFVLVHVGDAAAVNAKMLQAGVIVRPVANYGLPECLRVSVGLPEDNERCLQALQAAL